MTFFSLLFLFVGWIGAYSEGEGRGSTFFVELPLFSKEMVSFVTSLKVVTSSHPVQHQARKGSHSVHSVGTHPKTKLFSSSPGISYSDVLSLDRKIRYRSNSENFNFSNDVCQSRQLSQSTVLDIYPDPADYMERDGDEDKSSKSSCRYIYPSLSKASSVKSVRSGKISIFNPGSIRRVGCDSCNSENTETGYIKGNPKPVPLSGPFIKPREAPLNVISNSVIAVKVLVVDDSMSTRKVLSKLLLKKGYDVQCAEDGLICLDLVAQCSSGKGFDIILMDDYMPNLAGRETAKILRERGFKGFICGVTGNTNLEDNLAYEAYGANTVLPKPLDIALFEKIVDTHMKNDFTLKELTETLCQ